MAEVLDMAVDDVDEWMVDEMERSDNFVELGIWIKSGRIVGLYQY